MIRKPSDVFLLYQVGYVAFEASVLRRFFVFDIADVEEIVPLIMFFLHVKVKALSFAALFVKSLAVVATDEAVGLSVCYVLVVLFSQ